MARRKREANLNKETNMNENEKNENEKKEMVLVMARFLPEELEAMKEETGADANATAVVCYVRKNLRNR